MMSGVIVLRGVLVLGRIAAADVSALEAEPQVDPAVADGQTLLATVGGIPFAVEQLRRDFL